MARIIDAFTQYFDDKGNPLERGQLFFFETGTVDTKKDTFSTIDEDTSKKNTNPVILDGEGRVPNIFGTGSYNITLRSKATSTSPSGELINQFDPVGGQDQAINLPDWDSDINYSKFNIVRGSNGEVYTSETNDNLNNDPVSDGGVNWKCIRPIVTWQAGTTFKLGEICQTSDGDLWKSLVADNLGNDPTTNPSNWQPSINVDKITYTSIQHFYRNR